jgi:hypothetical protein
MATDPKTKKLSRNGPSIDTGHYFVKMILYVSVGTAGEEIPRPPSGESNTSSVCYYHSFTVQEHCSKKNKWTLGLKRGGRSNFAQRTGYSPYIRSSKDSADAQRLLVQLLSGGCFSPNFSFPLGFPLRVVLEFKLKDYYTKKRALNRKAKDLTNIAQTIEDCLQKSNVIIDDAYHTTLLLFKRPGTENRVTIWILKDG